MDDKLRAGGRFAEHEGGGRAESESNHEAEHPETALQRFARSAGA